MKKLVLFLAMVGLLALVAWMFWPESAGTASSAPTTGATPPPATVAATPPQAEAPRKPVSFDMYLLLISAIDNDDLQQARTLLDQDPRLAMIQDGQYPLHHVQGLEMAQLLMKYGANTEVLDTEFQARPIRWILGRSVKNHDKAMAAVKYLAEIGGGGDVDIAYLVASGDVPALKVMLEQDSALAQSQTGKDILGDKYTMINLAAKFNQPEVVELLLDHGADVNSRGGEFYDAPALEYAAWAGNTLVVKVLIDHKADVNAVVHTADQGDHTALWWAALTGRKDVVKLLVEAGAIVDPALPEEVAKSKITPYFGRNLPPQEDYDAVIKLLNEHITH